MRTLLYQHVVLMLFLVGIFFSLGGIDKMKLEQASMTHHPELIFAHRKLKAQDGGSIFWQSFIYSAVESRQMEVLEHRDKPMEIVDGFQGITWKWKFHNLLWILLITCVSYIYRFIRKRKSERA